MNNQNNFIFQMSSFRRQIKGRADNKAKFFSESSCTQHFGKLDD